MEPRTLPGKRPASGRRAILRRWMIGIGIVFFAASAFVLPAFLIHEPDIMSKAQRVRGAETEGYAVQQYTWQPDGTLTLVRMGHAHCFEVWHIDPKTGAKTLTRTLDRALSHKLYSSFWYLSPDGTRLLTKDDRMRHTNDMISVSLTDGTRQSWSPVSYHVNLLRAWLPDGKGWIEGWSQGKGNSVNLFAHALDGSLSRNVGVLNWNSQYFVSPATSPAGILLQDVSVNMHLANHKVDFALLKPSGENLSVETLSLAAPKEAKRLERAALSPDGTRIACEFDSLIEPAPLQKWLHSLFNAKTEQASKQKSLWILRRDGSAMHRVGILPDNGPRGIGRLDWTPDGKNISFESEGGLYTVPAD